MAGGPSADALAQAPEPPARSPLVPRPPRTLPTPPALHCRNCGQAMKVLALAGHYGQPVEIDLCADCHLLWFDAIESARLTGPSLLALLRELAGSQKLAHQVLRPDLGCARCGGPLKTVHNRSRWGRSLQLECRQHHGAYQSFGQFLSEKGLVRPLSSADRAALLRQPGGLSCLNCGASLGANDSRCRHCDSPPGLFDVARLAAALDPEGATEGHAVHAQRSRHTALACLACGAPVPADQALQCGHCQATLAVGRLDEAFAAVAVLESALQAHQQAPAPHVRAKRLARLQGDLSRRRDWAKDMEASARSEQEATTGLSGLSFGRWDDWRITPGRAVGLVLLLLFWWWLAGGG